MVHEKLLRLNIAEIKQIISNEEEKVFVHWIPTSLMLSDCLTKIGASSGKLSEVMESGTFDLETLHEARACLKE